MSAVAALIRARVLLADGDATAATAVLSRLRETWGPAHPALADVLTIAEGEVALRDGNTGRARAVLLLVEEGEHFDRADGRLLRGGLLIAEGDFKSRAGSRRAVPGRCGGGAADGVTLQEQISGLLVAAVAHRRLGSHRRGRGAAGAGAGAGRAGRRLPGVPGRGRLGPLGDDRAGPADQPPRRLRRADPGAVRRPGAPARRAAGRASVPLTDSERAVLRFLPSHMTNEEISQALFLSINTVKTHLRSAYRKLGVGSRREAHRPGPPAGPAVAAGGRCPGAAAAPPGYGAAALPSGGPGRPARSASPRRTSSQIPDHPQQDGQR